MKYTGGCHCGAVRFEVETKIEKLIACNCSICTKRGYLLTFVPEDKFRLTSSPGTIANYQFGKKNIHHLFCNACGVGSFGKGKDKQGNPMRAINARCLDDVDLRTFPIMEFDGKSL